LKAQKRLIKVRKMLIPEEAFPGWLKRVLGEAWALRVVWP
jgi:hypothetical protein